MSESYVYAFRRLDLIRDNLYHALQKTNRISAWKLAETAHDFQRVDDVLREAGMVEYLPSARLWVPDIGTYDWLIKQRERIINAARRNLPSPPAQEATGSAPSIQRKQRVVGRDGVSD